MQRWLRILGNTLITLGLIYIALGFWPVISAEAWCFFSSSSISWNEKYPKKTQDGLPFVPADESFSIIIPKIHVNTPIIQDVPTFNESEYQEALKQGVAHAKNTDLPSNNSGNTYLFAHSTPNIFDIQKYSATFTLLNKLKEDDKVVIVYKKQVFIYTVIGNEVITSFDLTPLTRTSEVPLLTLQTCDPPGIPLNRRIVTAVLEKVEEYKGA